MGGPFGNLPGTFHEALLKVATPCSSPGAELLVDLVGGLVLGFALGLFNLVAENAMGAIYRALEKQSRIRRISPSDPAANHFYHAESFWAVSLAFAPVGFFLTRARRGFLARASLRVDPLEMLLTQWGAMVLHDAWFYTIHMLMHRYKWAFRRFHALHHKSGGSVSVFSTAFVEWADLALTISAFHGLVMVWFFTRPPPRGWSVPAALWYFAVENAANMVGHCGYFLPRGVQCAASLGSLVTPWNQNSETHFVHHLDPRYNKALYFTWWDRLGGSFRRTHPLIERNRASGARHKNQVDVAPRAASAVRN